MTSKPATIADEVPWSESLTAYDEAHLPLYARLLDAEAAGAKVDEIARLVLKIDPSSEPDRAANCLSSHLRRARWMTESGYHQLLRPRAHSPQ